MSPSPVRINKIVICKYNNSGFCKFEDHCKYIHIMTNCTKMQCKTKGCPNRHPKPCRYKERCKRIRTCKFKHFETNNEKMKKEEKETLIKELREEITKQNENIKEKEKIIKELKDDKGVKYSCDLCLYKATTKDSLTKHQQSIHVLKYSCDQCEHKATEKEELIIINEKQNKESDINIEVIRKLNIKNKENENEIQNQLITINDIKRDKIIAIKEQEKENIQKCKLISDLNSCMDNLKLDKIKIINENIKFKEEIKTLNGRIINLLVAHTNMRC